jgi:hypothetical protein
MTRSRGLSECSLCLPRPTNNTIIDKVVTLKLEGQLDRILRGNFCEYCSKRGSGNQSLKVIVTYVARFYAYLREGRAFFLGKTSSV